MAQLFYNNGTAADWPGVTGLAGGGQLITDPGKCAERGRVQTPRQGLYCNSSFDNIYCWPNTPAGYTVYMPCPKGYDNTKILAYRICTETGEWLKGNWSNYTLCVPHKIRRVPPPDLSMLLAVRDIYFAGSALSLLMLCISMFIFCYFRRLHCDRIRIHKQLLLSLIFRSIILIILMQPGDDSGPSYMNEPVVCRSLVVLSQYFSMSNIFWMLVEGLFLYMRCVVAVFHYLSSLAVFYVIGWGAPALFVAAWTVVMYLFDTERCWMDYTRLSYAWIVSGPIVVVLVVNLYFLLHILVVLITKMKADQQSTQFAEPWYDLSVGLRLTVPPPASAPKPFPRTVGELTRIRKALKAMFILLPLLGLTNLLFFVDPQDGGLGEDIYQVFNAVMQATQGMFVSMIYCFTNAEVQNVIRDKLGHRNHQPKFDMQGPAQRRGLLASTTASTTVTQSHAETRL